MSDASLTSLVAAAADSGAPHLALHRAAGGRPVVVWANHLVLELLGLSHDDVVGASLRDLGEASVAAIDREDPEDWRMATARLIDDLGGRAVAVVSRPDAALVRVQVEVTGVRSVGWVVALRWTRDADEALKEAEHRFLALAEHAPIGIVLSEAGARLSYVNRWFERCAGMTSAELLGTGWLNAMHPEDRLTVDEAVRQVLSGMPTEHTVRLRPTADPPRWVTLRLAPVTTPRRAAGFIGTAEDVTARRAWEEQLTYQASHDALTGLANRRYLIETLTRLLKGRRTKDATFAVMFCDLDGFKRINDTFGHDAGDQVLIEVAARLARTARDHDLVSRIAGDEFVVVLRRIRDVTAAEASARRFLAALAKPLLINGINVNVSTSVGITLPGEEATPESLLRAADHAMYLAKAGCPGGYQVAPTTTRATSTATRPPIPPSQGR